ncbi:EGF-like domain protein, partial [Cooperia oncophora]
LFQTWISGVLYNFTTHFVRGTVGAPKAVFTDLVEYIIKKNNYEVGKSKLFISPDQMNPFTSCYNSDCHVNAICTPLGKGYSCQCPNGYRDLNPSHPGRQCLAYVGVNECEKPELNECSPDARCIDLDYLYKCGVISPYVNAAPEGAVPGSICTIDYCSDVHYCPLNSTCKNVGDQAKCDCNPGFVDLRKSDRLSEAGLGDAICMRHTDVNECALGLHNCSAAAICTDLKNGYECKCPDGYTDGNPQNLAEYVRHCSAVCATVMAIVFMTVSPITSPAHVSTAIPDSCPVKCRPHSDDDSGSALPTAHFTVLPVPMCTMPLLRWTRCKRRQCERP